MIVLVLLLGACGSKEPAAPVVGTKPAVPPSVAKAPASTTNQVADVDPKVIKDEMDRRKAEFERSEAERAERERQNSKGKSGFDGTGDGHFSGSSYPSGGSDGGGGSSSAPAPSAQPSPPDKAVPDPMEIK